MGVWNLKIEQGIAVLEFDQPDSRVNVLDSSAMEELERISEDINRRPKESFRALLVTSKKEGIFIAGADIKEIEHITTDEEAFSKAQKGKEIFDKFSRLAVERGMPTVAVINGACLGGGLELALACRYRVAGFSEKIKIGLPEVKLGIIPGFGGTQRLPRLIGLGRAVSMIAGGEAVSSREAFKIGLVDALFMDSRLSEEAVDFVKEILDGKRKVKRCRKKGLILSFLEDTPVGRAVFFNQARKNILKKTKGFYPAPLRALDVLARTAGGGAERGADIESRAFAALARTQVSKNLIHVFYLTEEYRKRAWADPGIRPKDIRDCAVLGAGIMGGGIAQLLSFYDLPARVKDITFEALKTALKTAKNIFDGARKRKILKPHQVDVKFGFISPTLTYRGFEKADIVIEAVVEDLLVKQKVFKELSSIAAPTAVLVSNTSSLPITKIAESAARPERVAGMHFFNPVHRMPLVEVIRGAATSDETVASVVALARRIGKTVIVVGDVAGFLVNRILLSYMNEAAWLAEEGCGIERVDRIARDFGMPMGPLELADEVGIDVGYKVAKILEEAYGERMRVSALLGKIKEANILGKKTQAGFYLYGRDKKSVNPKVLQLLGGVRASASSEDIIKRLIYGMVNEAGRCLQERVVDKPQTVDVGMIMGTGFPAFRGGLLRYADSVGIGAVVSDLEKLYRATGVVRFKPCALLISMREKKQLFYQEIR